ncbi:MAG: helix-turn-helix transcriptional regulator [Psychrosphaera sp.]|nr:helix-turn-helix transcriptional regulator [Psychrosphaera sp.]
MIKCYLSRILGDKKLKVAEIARDTGINKNTLHRLYNETATRIDLEVVEQLCRYLNIEIGELFEIKEEVQP